jgi:hypothetical protein
MAGNPFPPQLCAFSVRVGRIVALQHASRGKPACRVTSLKELTPVDLGVHLPIRGRRDMKLKLWIHSVLHIGCVTLLLLQGHRIQQVQKFEAERRKVETDYANHLKRGLSNFGVLSTELPPLECFRRVDPEPSIFSTTKTYFCVLPEMQHEAALR